MAVGSQVGFGVVEELINKMSENNSIDRVGCWVAWLVFRRCGVVRACAGVEALTAMGWLAVDLLLFTS